MIEYIDVHKAFDVPVLTGVNLTVETRETLSIVGPSGTGKSVLLKTTNALLVPDRGDVRIDGVSVYQSGRDALAEIRRKVGYVFQYAALFDSMSVFENVCTGLRDGEARRARSPEILRKVCECARGRQPRPRAGAAQAAVGAVGRHAQARGPRAGHRRAGPRSCSTTSRSRGSIP